MQETRQNIYLVNSGEGEGPSSITDVGGEGEHSETVNLEEEREG